MIDANNLYGGIMEKFPLPLNSFEFNDQVTIAEILNTSRESEIGYILDVDVLYPDHLHDAHSDYPLAPTKEVVSKMWLSELQLDMLKKMNISDKVGTTPKLIQNFFPKKNYTVHYLTLQLYVKLGLKIEKVNRVLQFRQEKFIAPYVQLNTELRKKATTKFEQDFFKQIIISAFGKFCESKRNRLIVDIVRNAEELQNLSRKKRFSSIKIIDQHLVSVTSKPVNINWDKPTIVGATILDLAKFYMFQFHNNIIKKNFDATLLYSDTDSFLYEIRSKDLYNEIEKNHELRNQFDFSNLPATHPLYTNENLRVTLKFKDEFAGEIIQEYVGLKPKLYSIISSSKFLFFYHFAIIILEKGQQKQIKRLIM